ncbi:GDYXXLXY domain-containing protein [Solimonas soli]|uniref:GDYXXLXY domain-containing protein n=1 Tax=Solimonas soli TaxID=413479 RepID=UPI0004B42A0D|nr:GDYXXLXY domain-containing protein [Solimonas soli]
MRRAWALALLLLACALQWALPAALALRSEQALRSGARYYLRTAPLDPLDPFRGRYVTLSFDARAPVRAADAWQYGERVYVPIRTGADRYASFGAPSRTAPAEGDYLEARVGGFPADGVISLRLPFDRYYLDEHAAPAAERAYREANGRDAKVEAYVSIRVRGGHAALEELFIDNRPLRQYLREAPPPR